MKGFSNIITNQKGQALIEFITVVLIFCVLLYGIIDLTQMGIIKHVLDSSCREGARAASAIPSLSSSNDIVFSRIRKILIDGKVMTNSRITQPISTPKMQFIRAGVDGGIYAQSDDIIVVSIQVEYNNLFSMITGRTVTITGEAVSKYLI